MAFHAAQVHRDIFVMDAPPGKLLPDQFNVPLYDIRPEDLATKVSMAMHCPYLSPSCSTRLQKVQGCIYGPIFRSMFTLPVTCEKSGEESNCNVHFLFDTAAPATYLAPSALAAWKIPAWDMDNNIFHINGCRIRPSCSDDQAWDEKSKTREDRRFKGVNLLGMDFIERADALYTLSLKRNICCLEFE